MAKPEIDITPLELPRWSSSGQDMAMRDNEFTGRLDFNQHTRLQDYGDELPENTRSDPMLEVQRPVRLRDKRVFCPGALNFKRHSRRCFEASDTDYSMVSLSG